MGRPIAAVIALLAIVVLATDVWNGPVSSGPFRLSALGEWWAWLHRDSLLLLQPAIERHIAPFLWDPVMLSLLEWPLAIELAVLAAVTYLGARRRGRGKRSGSRALDLKKK
ncbi:MAG: hypothetical protein AAGC57_13035 [Pseudomonadota bacterium]